MTVKLATSFQVPGFPATGGIWPGKDLLDSGRVREPQPWTIVLGAFKFSLPAASAGGVPDNTPPDLSVDVAPLYQARVRWGACWSDGDDDDDTLPDEAVVDWYSLGC